MLSTVAAYTDAYIHPQTRCHAMSVSVYMWQMPPSICCYHLIHAQMIPFRAYVCMYEWQRKAIWFDLTWFKARMNGHHEYWYSVRNKSDVRQILSVRLWASSQRRLNAKNRFKNKSNTQLSCDIGLFLLDFDSECMNWTNLF